MNNPTKFSPFKVKMLPFTKRNVLGGYQIRHYIFSSLKNKNPMTNLFCAHRKSQPRELLTFIQEKIISNFMKYFLIKLRFRENKVSENFVFPEVIKVKF